MGGQSLVDWSQAVLGFVEMLLRECIPVSEFIRGGGEGGKGRGSRRGEGRGGGALVGVVVVEEDH